MNKRKDLPNVSWITKDGCLDFGKFPIQGILEQSPSEDPERDTRQQTVLGEPLAMPRIARLVGL